MSFSYYLLQIPSVALLFTLVFLFGGIGALITSIFRRYLHTDPRRSHNEVVGNIFTTVGSLYGLLLGFVVFLVWNSFETAQTHADTEGSIARGLYRDIKYYPHPEKTAEVRRTLVHYAQYVVEQEYPRMERLQPPNYKDRAAFNDLFEDLEKIQGQDNRVEEMFRHLNELDTYRSLRQLDGDSKIPLTIWMPLIIGAFIILILATLLDIESHRLHLMVNSLLGCFIGLMFFIIIVMDHPFTGAYRIGPDEYKQIINMELHDR